MWTLLLISLAGSAVAVTRDQFYPNGPGIDQRLPRGSEVASPEIPLAVPIHFYGSLYESIYVNNFGVLTFRADLSSFINDEFPLPYPSIAAFYSNIDTTESGIIYYRETNDPYVLIKAEESVQNNFHDYYDFKPTSVFIASWIDVTYTSNQRTERKNSFQIAIISNGTESFVELLYPEREIQWIQRETVQTSLPEAKAQVGFVSEDGRVFTLRGSGSHQIRNVVSWSNTHEPGKYVFRVGNIPLDGNVAAPDQYDQNEVEVEEESKTCAQSGPSVCHIQARCVDYQAGICCQCIEGFYGNGKSCVKDDVPLRAHGKLNGNINNLNVNDIDVQAYVVVADGRSYTALSQSPPKLGSSLQFLNILGGVIGWLFAKPSGSAKNGYQLTGAIFNHTADIYFPATTDRIFINQEYIGHNVFDQITFDADVRGTLPVIVPGTKLEVSEYDEQYTIAEAGVVRSVSTRKFINKVSGEEYVQQVTQTFTYNPCRFAPTSEEDTEQSTLKVAKNYLNYETRDNIVRYGSSNKISNMNHDDPCNEGRNSCGPYSTCVVQEESYTCVCQSGFTNTHYGNSITCVDIDECSAGTHNCDNNADCYNNEGSFQCSCHEGYEGNGVTCKRISRCRDKICDPNAQCLDNGEDFSCLCNSGFTGDGQTCWPIYNVCSYCSPRATCAFSSQTNSNICQCSEGYIGDGYNCVEATSSTPDVSETASVTEQNTWQPDRRTAPNQYRPQQPDYSRPPDYSSPQEPEYHNPQAPEYSYPQEPDYPSTPASEYPRPPSPEYPYPQESDYPRTPASQYSRPPSPDYPRTHQSEYPRPPSPDYSRTPAYEYSTEPAPEHTRPTYPEYNTTPPPEYNETYVLPNCDSYGCNCPHGYAMIKDERDNDLCRYDSYRASIPLPESDPAIPCTADVDCPPNAVCSFSPVEPYSSNNQYTGHCTCPEGYEGDAYECTERAGSSCSCGLNAHCVDTAAGQLICVCDAGYHGDGYLCQPNFSCSNNSDCEFNAECRPDPNTNEYVCQCIEGYIKDQNDACIPDGQLCNGAVCAEHASCLYDENMDVSYCHCDTGYTGQGISQCVPQGRTCDVVHDCNPDAVCTPTEISYQCVCREGFTGDGYVCTPESNCRTNPYLCDVHASCLKTSDGYECECNVGYNGNGSSCSLSPRKAGNFLVASDGASVYRVPFKVTPWDFATPLNSAVSQIAVGIDVDCMTGWIYWGDVVSNTIKRAAYDGSGLEQFLSYDVKSPEGVSVDWAARNIFWTDSKKLTIEVANLATKTRTVLFSGEGIFNPRGIVVHPGRGKIFWSDWNRHDPKIEWANMDGSQRGVFLDKSDVKLPNSLAIDWSRDRLCYADAGFFSIKCVGIDTLQRETIASNCSYPFGLAIYGDKFYWTDWKTLKIEYIDSLSGIRGQVQIATASRLYGVTVAPDQCPVASNVCIYRNGNCEADQLCLPDGRGGRTCVNGDSRYQN